MVDGEKRVCADHWLTHQELQIMQLHAMSRQAISLTSVHICAACDSWFWFYRWPGDPIATYSQYNRIECETQCNNSTGCNAAAWNPFTYVCLVMEIGETADAVYDYDYDGWRLCEPGVAFVMNIYVVFVSAVILSSHA